MTTPITRSGWIRGLLGYRLWILLLLLALSNVANYEEDDDPSCCEPSFRKIELAEGFIEVEEKELKDVGAQLVAATGNVTWNVEPVFTTVLLETVLTILKEPIQYYI